MKKTVLALCLLASYFLAPMPQAQTAPKVLRMALGDPENSEMGVVGRAFKDYVEEKSNGAIHIEMHYAGSLGDESFTVQNVIMGQLDMSMAGIANVAPHVHQLGVLTLPYLFDNIGQVVTATNGAPAELLNSYAVHAGFRILAWAYTDYRYFSNAKRPVTTMEDMKGLTFRVPANPVLVETYKAFGATPVPLSWSETFPALKQGTVDGQCYGYIGFRAMKFQEAHQKYITEAHYTYQLQPLIISSAVYRDLSREEKDILRAAGRVAQEVGLDYVTRESNKAKQELIEQGITVCALKDEAAWKKAAIEQVWPKMAVYVGGKRFINVFLQACGKAPWKP